MDQFEFQAVLKRPEGVGTWTYLDIPIDMARAFGSKGRIKIRGTINGCPFRSSALPHGDGTHYLVVNSAIRNALGVAQGAKVKVVLEADTGDRTVTIPPDLKRALSKGKSARAAFDALSYSRKKEFVEWIESAKRDETRVRRVTLALDMLLEGTTPKSRR